MLMCMFNVILSKFNIKAQVCYLKTILKPVQWSNIVYAYGQPVALLKFYSIFILQQQDEEGVQHERPQQTYTQTTVAEAFLRQLKYDKNSPEARKLNQAVAEFMYGCLYGCICMDVCTANSKALQPKVPASKPKLFNVHWDSPHLHWNQRPHNPTSQRETILELHSWSVDKQSCRHFHVCNSAVHN